jgi:hypothetical protein
MITAMTQFNQREGHCNVLANHIEHLDGGLKLQLGVWLTNQRHLQKSKLMDAQKEKRLESLGVTWRSDKKPETASDRFDRNFDLLVAFHEREGHVRVPNRHQESDNDNLGSWLATQRSRYRRGALELDEQRLAYP